MMKKYIKYRTDMEIEYMHAKAYDGHRFYYYRIKPSELPLWRRWFHNPWRRVFHSYESIDGYKFSYTPKEYAYELLPLKTFGDMCEYLERHRKIIDEAHLRRIQSGEIWPDE